MSITQLSWHTVIYGPAETALADSGNIENMLGVAFNAL